MHRLLKQLLADGKINRQQYRTYKGQVLSGDVTGCVKGLLRKRLITPEKAERVLANYKKAV